MGGISSSSSSTAAACRSWNRRRSRVVPSKHTFGTGRLGGGRLFAIVAVAADAAILIHFGQETLLGKHALSIIALVPIVAAACSKSGREYGCGCSSSSSILGLATARRVGRCRHPGAAATVLGRWYRMPRRRQGQ